MYDIQPSDVDASRWQAWRFLQRHDEWQLDLDDTAHDALYGLYVAALTYDPRRGDWALHRTVKVSTAIANGARSEMIRKRRLRHAALPDYDGDEIPESEWSAFVDRFVRVEDVAITRELLGAVGRVLGLESPLVRDAVLRVDSDTALAHMYGTTLSNIAQRRRSALARINRTPEAVLYGDACPAKCSRCENYAAPSTPCTACHAMVT